MAVFEKWQQRYLMNGVTTDQLQRLVDLGTLTEAEFTTITGQEPDDLSLQRWRASTRVGPLQLRRALRASGHMPQIQAYLDTAPEEVKEAWQFATAIPRLDSLILAVQADLEVTDEEVDQLFELALTFP